MLFNIIFVCSQRCAAVSATSANSDGAAPSSNSLTGMDSGDDGVSNARAHKYVFSPRVYALFCVYGYAFVLLQNNQYGQLLLQEEQIRGRFTLCDEVAMILWRTRTIRRADIVAKTRGLL